MKITEYPFTSTLLSADVLLTDGTNGTKQILASDLPYALLHLCGVGAHRMIFRGKNLGTSVSYSQTAAIQAGTFEDLWLGDYWEINGVKWRIADFNYWKGTGDTTEFTANHLVIVPDSNLATAKMNDTDITTGAYIGSLMYTTNMATAKSAITTAFPNVVKTHREYLTNATTNGYPSAGAWTDSQIDLMNEPMVFGSYIYTPGSTGTDTPKRYTNSATQLALFRVRPDFICKPEGAAARISYWLRDVVNSTSFVRVSSYGAPQDTSASQSYGVRPAFAIG